MTRRIALTLAAALALPGVAVAQTKWDMPTPYPPANFHTENIVKFADDVKAATGGKLVITVHPAGSLFKLPEIKRAVQTGQAQIGETLISAMENEDPIYGADAVPFIATSYAAAKKLADAQRPMLDKRFGAQGMKVLYMVPWPPQGLYSPKPLQKIEDMQGLKFRAYNPATSKIAELVGAQPVTIQAAELGQAFATGRVNSFISSGSTGYDVKVWEFIKHFYDTQAWLPKNVVFVNADAFGKLAKAEQDAVLKAAADAEKRGWAESEKQANFYLEEFKKHGMIVEKPSQALADGFKKIGEQLAADWAKRAGEDGQNLLAALK
ncbi:MAG: TRAP transporter substrate-binding protein [Rhodospirillales bacterium]|nr:TRAP transporter substrate-binding protein [Rhodospirillales bacterium]